MRNVFFQAPGSRSRVCSYLYWKIRRGRSNRDNGEGGGLGAARVGNHVRRCAVKLKDIHLKSYTGAAGEENHRGMFFGGETRKEMAVFNSVLFFCVFRCLLGWGEGGGWTPAKKNRGNGVERGVL